MSEQNSRYIERHNYLEKKDTNTCRLKKHIQPTPGSFIEKGNNTATRKTFTKKSAFIGCVMVSIQNCTWSRKN